MNDRYIFKGVNQSFFYHQHRRSYCHLEFVIVISYSASFHARLKASTSALTTQPQQRRRLLPKDSWFLQWKEDRIQECPNCRAHLHYWQQATVGEFLVDRLANCTCMADESDGQTIEHSFSMFWFSHLPSPIDSTFWIAPKTRKLRLWSALRNKDISWAIVYQISGFISSRSVVMFLVRRAFLECPMMADESVISLIACADMSFRQPNRML